MDSYNMLTVKTIALMMDCHPDTARERMQEMPGCVNVGSEKRRQLLVPLSGLREWLASHRVQAITMPVHLGSQDGRMARKDRRTGEIIKK